jgi:hypothetical protein
MQVRVRKVNADGVVKLESSGEVKDILINEDFLNPNGESISLCFRGKHSSGIIDLTPEELEHVYKAVHERLHLIKGMKKFRDYQP